ncbi:MAG TPA: adenylate/guanylate cyclase domain-containing protein [Polyangiaceae bacterium]|nr:adenylate/guanylate cyclase domain-containing protein [Polyangiaceae bacterium]
MWDALVRWIISDAPRLPFEAIISGLGERLRAEHMPVERLSCRVMEVNPLSSGYSLTWQPGHDIQRHTPSRSKADSLHPRAAHGAGPMVHAEITAFGRLRLDQLPAGSWGLPQLYWDEHFTDVVAFATPRSLIGSATLLTFATRDERGFTQAQVDRIRELRDALGLVFDLRTQASLTQTLAHTYLGKGVSQRVLSGQIHRGDGVTIPAALWFSDLRGFTVLADRIPRDELIDLLNDAFESQVTSVEEHDGEVLKFIGDGLLAIFPVNDATSPELTCQHALAAARACESRLAVVNDARAARSAPTIEYGLALHFGDVMYGNIGAPGRLDFTVIGPAVNLAARLEGVAAQLGRPLVLSATFASLSGAAVTSAGVHSLKGVTEPCEVFVPREVHVLPSERPRAWQALPKCHDGLPRLP